MAALAFGTVLTLEPFAVRLQAAVALVKEASVATANDAVIDFGSATSASNCVIIGVKVTGSGTLDVAGVVENVLHTALHSVTTVRGYLVSFPGGSQTYTLTSSGADQSGGIGIEVSGANSLCTEDGTSESIEDASSPYNLATGVNIADGSILFAYIVSGNTSDYTADGSFTASPASGTDAGNALAQFRVTTAGTYDCPFTSAAAENSLLLCAAVSQAAVGGTPRGPLLGVLP